MHPLIATVFVCKTVWTLLMITKCQYVNVSSDNQKLSLYFCNRFTVKQIHYKPGWKAMLQCIRNMHQQYCQSRMAIHWWVSIGLWGTTSGEPLHPNHSDAD